MTVDGQDEREPGVELEIATGRFHPHHDLVHAFNRQYVARKERFTDDVLLYSRSDESVLVRSIEDSAEFADVFMTAAERSIRVGDPYVRDALAALVAAALRDDSRIPTINYLLSRLESLDPLHIRLLARFPRRLKIDAAQTLRLAHSDRELSAGDQQDLLTDWSAIKSLLRREFPPFGIADEFALSKLAKADLDVVQAAMSELHTYGFVTSMIGPSCVVIVTQVDGHLKVHEMNRENYYPGVYPHQLRLYVTSASERRIPDSTAAAEATCWALAPLGVRLRKIIADVKNDRKVSDQAPR